MATVYWAGFWICGAWLFVVCMALGHTRGAALPISILALLWPVTAVLMLVLVIIHYGPVLADYERKYRQKRLERALTLRADADVQHAAVLRGDHELGVYGRYPPGGQVIVPPTRWEDRPPPTESWTDPFDYEV